MISAKWQTTKTVPTLGLETHIWSISLRKNAHYIDVLKSWLSARELERSQRIVIPYKRNYLVQSKAWLRWLLGQYTKSQPENINYTHGHLGKPYLDKPNFTIQFNATDSGDTLLIALNNSHELGLDIEAVPRTVSHQQIARKKFTREEQVMLGALPEHEQSSAFLALWTRKEAYGKAIGLGIRYPMHTVNLCDSIANPHFQYTDHQQQIWYLYQLNGDDFIACLVSAAACPCIRLFKLDVDLLLTDNQYD